MASPPSQEIAHGARRHRKEKQMASPPSQEKADGDESHLRMHGWAEVVALNCAARHEVAASICAY